MVLQTIIQAILTFTEIKTKAFVYMV